MRLPDNTHHSPEISVATQETVEEALAVLGDLLRWRSSPGHWERIEPVVTRMQEALAIGDGEALRHVTAELELMGPTRITRIGSTSLVPPPPRIRDRTNQLIHSLGGDTAPLPSTAAADEAEAGDA
ncbi:CATRA system-associated protein [Acrocarpospora pleiomorpha]|uniref:CATRA system-associated protein n=1 Tax=Acrocarpospora pleiomorpha TaxID=90975 RepID=UPI0035A2331B